MFDLADRNFDVRTVTGPLLGPNTYVLCDGKPTLQNFAPFLSCQERKSAIINKTNTDVLYNVRDFGKNIKNCASLKSNSKRFVRKTDDDIPPPTRYNPVLPKCRKCPKLDPSKPKLYFCTVPHNITITAPSVPTKKDSNGYDLDRDGNILKVPFVPPKSQELNIKSEFPTNIGYRWSCRNAVRFDDKSSLTVGPGPAAYYPQLPKCPQAEADEKYREMARLFSFLPRFLEAQEMQARKEGRPGPGSYNIHCAPGCRKAKAIRPVPFISNSRRFQAKEASHQGPSAATYCVDDSALRQRQFSIKNAPFGFQSERFRRRRIDNLPGPADYCIKGPLLEKLEHKKNVHATCIAPFNQTAERRTGFVKRDAATTPSPADYPLVQESDDEEDPMHGNINSSVFKNAVERFKTMCQKDALGPANYSVTKPFNKNRGRTPYGSGMAPFNFAGPRSTTPAIFRGSPCPTMYENTKPLFGCGYSFKTTPRFDELADTPGPGDYEINAAYTNSLFRTMDTHNLRLRENVLKKKIRLPTRQTRKQWCSVLKKRKLLKKFDMPPDYEEIQAMLIHKLFENPV